ncbi:nucleolar protein 14 [Phyllostomus discolor]|uniref:Nucleolar protein 14 n=1 Tax=Phyllostomus discolor TaxID=89673 RepID=A0A6J2KYA4_9CHIR|nr:nucleolar protein 14 [Phyllostomus discolor]
MGKARAIGARTKPPGAPAGAGVPRTKPNPNPFEVKVNRQKFQVLGRKMRHDVGMPGVSRARAIQKRNRTLLREYREREKSNVFRDRRLGEHSSSMSPEEKMARRFALEQQRQHEKKNIYNLNEDEELTHYGQSLADIEKHHDIVDSDSDAEDRGALSAELTAAHFGGGGPQRTSQQPGQEGERPRSRKELIEELITKSKQEKRERQAQREDTLELTEKLDRDWREVQSLLARKAPKPQDGDRVERPQPDAYDVMVRELGFEMKAQPSNRMKTEEELAKEEQARLQRLEAERVRRMLGQDAGEDTRRPTHVSVDDLHDGFVLDQDDRRPLTYRDGRMDVQQELSGEAGDGVQAEEEEGQDSSEEDAEDSGGSDGHSDLECEEEEEEAECEEEEQEGEQPEQEQRRRQTPSGQATGGGRDAREAAGAELPYTFEAPESSEDLKALLAGRSAEQQLLVVERIQKCHHPSLAEGNKAKLEKLFGFLLEHVGDLAADDPPDLGVVDKLVVPLYHLCQMFPGAASESVRFVLRNAMHEMEAAVEAKGRAAFPGLDVLVYLKIAGMLFPTSDFWHPVVTPALVCMSQLLTKCPVLSLRDAVKGLFVCCTFLDYVALSQRLVPELLNFLLGILYVATPNKPGQGYTLVHPFRPLGRNSELLVVSDEDDTATWQRKSLSLRWAGGQTAQTGTEANHTRLSCLAVCLALVKRCVLLYGALPAFHEVARPLRALLTQHLADPRHPPELQELCRSTLADMDAQGRRYRPLVCEKSKPVPLKLFTPRLVKVLEFGKKQGSSKEEQERKRLVHKHRREFKGAVREIRKDNQFLARMQLSEIMERDAERKRKVKQLFNSLAEQEGEWKALKRKKFKK